MHQTCFLLPPAVLAFLIGGLVVQAATYDALPGYGALPINGHLVMPQFPSYPAYPAYGYPSYPSVPQYPSLVPGQPQQTGTIPDPSKLTNRERLCYDVLTVTPTNLTAFNIFNPTVFIEHNPNFPSSKDAIVNIIKQSPASPADKVIRIFQDGDYVFAHSGISLSGFTKFNVWKFDQENFVGEHWDQGQAQPAIPNPSNHTMLDGPIQTVDLHLTEFNKALVAVYAQSQVALRLRVDLLAPNLIQHHPTIGDGVPTLIKGLLALDAQGQPLRYKSIFKVLGRGNFVLVMAPGTLASAPVGIYDLYRVENGKIVEAWSAVSVVPPRDKWANQNGKFNGFDN